MRKASLFVTLLTILAAPAFAQSAEFGLMVGGSKRIADLGSKGQPGINDFKFGNSVEEAYYATHLDPDSMFRIKVGAISGPVAFRTTDENGNPTITDVANGKIEHIDALVDYRFSEPFGSTGLFGGVGMYRMSASGQQDQTNVGLSGGVNGDFPLSRRYGVIVEATYHWLHTEVRQRYVTLTGGLRISF